MQYTDRTGKVSTNILLQREHLVHNKINREDCIILGAFFSIQAKGTFVQNTGSLILQLKFVMFGFNLSN